MGRIGAFIGASFLLMATAYAEDPSPVVTQHLKESFTSFVEDAQALQLQRTEKLKAQAADEHLAKWGTLTAQQRQQLRRQREEAIRAQAQQRLNQRRKGY